MIDIDSQWLLQGWIQWRGDFPGFCFMDTNATQDHSTISVSGRYAGHDTAGTINKALAGGKRVTEGVLSKGDFVQPTVSANVQDNICVTTSASRRKRFFGS